MAFTNYCKSEVESLFTVKHIIAELLSLKIVLSEEAPVLL